MNKYKFKEIPVGILRPDPVRGEDAMDEQVTTTLAGSMEDVGMLHPPIVRKPPRKKWRGYWFITGGKRIAAAKMDRTRKTITCRVVACTDQEAKEIFLCENLHRSHMSSEQQFAMREELDAVIEGRERAGKIPFGKTHHNANVARAAGVSERTIERDERFREKLSPVVREALRRREITVKQAEEFCRYSEEHQEDELAQIKASREQPMIHGDRGVRDEKPDEPNLLRPRSVSEKLLSFVSALSYLVETKLHAMLDSKEDVAALARVNPMYFEQLAYPLRKLKYLMLHLPLEHVRDLPLASGLPNLVVPRSGTDDREHAVPDAPAQVPPVKTVAGKKPIEEMGKPLIPMGRHKVRRQAA